MTTTATAPSTPVSFETLLAKMLPAFKFYAATKTRSRGDRFDDIVQELVGFSLVMYNSLVQRGKEIFYSALVRFAIGRYREGRRVAGCNTTDLLSNQAKMLGRSRTCQLSPFEADPENWRFMQDQRSEFERTVYTRLDYETWYHRQSPRDQEIISDLAMGETTNAVAAKYGVSAGLISIKRRQFAKSWYEFIDSEKECA